MVWLKERTKYVIWVLRNTDFIPLACQYLLSSSLLNSMPIILLSNNSNNIHLRGMIKMENCYFA